MDKLKNLPSFDMSKNLKNEEDIRIYYKFMKEENNPVLIAHANKVIKKARKNMQSQK